jgi:hypothetical protein
MVVDLILLISTDKRKTMNVKKSNDEVLALAKKQLVAELLTPEEVAQVSGGKPVGPHWQEFTRFVMQAG